MTPQTPENGPRSPAQPDPVPDATPALTDASEAAHDADARKAVERALDLADYWETVEPDASIPRAVAAAVLREVLS